LLGALSGLATHGTTPDRAAAPGAVPVTRIRPAATALNPSTSIDYADRHAGDGECDNNKTGDEQAHCSLT
jgi:hypothetical protein